MNSTFAGSDYMSSIILKMGPLLNLNRIYELLPGLNFIILREKQTFWFKSNPQYIISKINEKRENCKKQQNKTTSKGKVNILDLSPRSLWNISFSEPWELANCKSESTLSPCSLWNISFSELCELANCELELKFWNFFKICLNSVSYLLRTGELRIRINS